jgi:hypothetical protein
MKANHSLILLSILTATLGANAQMKMSSSKDLETAILILAHPEDRSEAKELVELAKTQGLSPDDKARLEQITNRVWRNFREGPNPCSVHFAKRNVS